MRAVLVGVDFGKGDFVASLEELGLLSKSAGAEPGPAAYGRGGPATVTDANLVLGRLRPDDFPHMPPKMIFIT